MATYQTVKVDGIEVFYREVGPADAPTILLLHGFPSSSRMWEPLLIRLADTFHLVAPDYPGFGHSDVPNPAVFDYTFDHLAEVIDGFTTKLGLTRYVLFLQDYGGPIGFRLALAHAERIQVLIAQNAVAHVSSRFCSAPARPTSRLTCSSTIRRTSRATLPGRNGFVLISRRCW
jgi:pimeloyl-ACP methyl ester carboxylesterase